MTFRDRTDAGRRLAAALTRYRNQKPVVLALPRGGVPVAREVAQALGAPLDLVLVRKIGVPSQPELAMGAIAEGNPPVVVRHEAVIREAEIGEAEFEAVRVRELAEIERRTQAYLAGRPRVDLKGRLAIVVDDGLATGMTMRAALRAVAAKGAARRVIAVPVAAVDVVAELRREADDAVCVEEHRFLYAIGAHYTDFSQVSDREVCEALARQAADGR